MANYDSNYAIAQEISARIGNAPIPFDSVYSIALQIYQELGGEESEFDSVYSILLGILPLAESVAKKTSITDIDKLPEPKDNNNIYRLNSNDKVYMSVRYPDTITNKLPDEQQIDKAFLYEDETAIYYYKGAWKFILNDGEVDGYGWLQTYPEGWYFFLTQDNAVNTTLNTKCFDTDDGSIDLDAHTLTLDFSISEFQWDDAYDLMGGGIAMIIPAIYNAPEAGCIGNAMFTDDDFGGYAIYSGVEVEYNDSTWYKWIDRDGGDNYWITSKKASEIYGIFTDGLVSDVKIYAFDGSEYTEVDYTMIIDTYIPQLNASDSEQVEKAYFGYIEEGEITNKDFYNNAEISIVLSDRTLTVYPWGDMSDLVASCLFTANPAYQLYSRNIPFYWGLDSFEWEISGNTLTCTDITYSEFEEECMSNLADETDYVLYTVPYTYHIQNWKWNEILYNDFPTDAEIDAIFE